MSADAALTTAVDRIDRWADTSRLNLWRMLVMPRPHLAEHEWRAFDELLPATPSGVSSRTSYRSRNGWCVHVRSESRYLFSIGSDPRRPESWTTGTVYALPRTTFRPTPGSRELVSEVPVGPRARLVVHPDDFPFRALTLRHHPGETPRRVAVRNALRRR